MKKIFVALLIASMLLVFGCAQQSTQIVPEIKTDNSAVKSNVENSDKPVVKEIELLVQHSGYTPSTITVNKGDTVRILATTISGQEWHKHGIAIDEYNISVPVQTTDKSNPVKIEFVADKEGQFKIYCKTCNDADGFKGKTGSTHPDIQATLIVK